MLTWKPGPKSYDGVWAPHWYANVHKSSGFEKQPTSERKLPDQLKPLAKQADVYYKKSFTTRHKTLGMLQKYNPKNENIIVHVGGKLLPRNDAKVSVFDSSVQGGDAVWEGLRVYNGGIFLFR
jgi:hypothetical protein